ncbi:hypothetical protein BBBOND_0103520 [Babesia bigemina]|uniref:non-specific serine/threonine protein kinase n=1 Tax=Babesia bigemina TaxID=5866 RepID=A0A061D040_BABBI|nr:hypothetical protein BBBOND_0103520 [Babesia bigemina]CDR94038.1 hypothetical protein BBBOND_0103520 [Babesia bigemina]|eukprot:XP_012766224.1 hypothetical protein BBBOND_0103520 [Babesia bigemina]
MVSAAGAITSPLLHYGTCQDVYLSCDSSGKHYALKRIYREDLEHLRRYRNSSGRLVRQSWFADLRRSISIQLLVQHERCVRCVCVSGFDLHMEDESAVGNEIDLVLEWCECGSLMELDSSAKIPHIPRDVLRCIAHDVIQALDYLASIKVAHGDVKPDNVFMEASGRCKLGDFSQSQMMTSDGQVTGARGSYYFLAPEIASNASDSYDGSAADMWAFGSSLWMLYFRRYPLRDPLSAPMELLANIAQFDIDNELACVRAAGESIDPEFESFIRGVLCKDPRSRLRPQAALSHPWLSSPNFAAAAAYAEGLLSGNDVVSV